jgi:hypothetical protein
MFRLDTLGSVQGHAGQGVLTPLFDICEGFESELYYFVKHPVEHQPSTSILHELGMPLSPAK